MLRFVLLAPFLLALGGCFSWLGFGGDSSVPPSERQLSSATQALLAIKGMRKESPIFIRIFKEESELEIWKWKDGRFRLFRTYPICAWSGGLGPKVQKGDRQAPEGFYTVSRRQMNPRSLYHLAFNIGFPNAYDSSNGHSGSALMVHGDCRSAGCYAMTDAYIEDIYILAREAFAGGQTRFHVHAMPFRMTARNMQRHRNSPWYPFWRKMKEGYDFFQATGKLPVVKVCSKQYMVNVSFGGHDPSPTEPCPAYAKLDPSSIRSIDGVPQSVLANLSGKAGHGSYPATQTKPVVAASFQTPPATSHAAAADGADTSASPVVSRVARRPAAVASMRTPEAPAVPAYDVPEPYAPEPQTAQMQATASPARPVNYNAPVTYAPTVAPAPTYTAAAVGPAPSYTPPAAPAVHVDQPDPNALQKLNRSGKGGKLSVSNVQATEGQ
jgi:murein L,D-transpeptidase YafK